MSQSQPSPPFGLPAPVLARLARLGRLLGALAGLGLCGCRCSDGDPEPTARAGDPLTGCRSACASYSQAACGGPGGAEGQRDCVAGCTRWADLARQAGCEAERDAYFACVGKSRVECASVLSAIPVALARGEGVPSCGARWDELLRCQAPCDHVGSTHLGDAELGDKRVTAELTRSGCLDCARDVRAAAPPGSPCTAARVCQEHCCSCQAGPSRYRVRACVDGACAGTELACALGPGATGHDPCGR
jgi:hypothetical protein